MLILLYYIITFSNFEITILFPEIYAQAGFSLADGGYFAIALTYFSEWIYSDEWEKRGGGVRSCVSLRCPSQKPTKIFLLKTY